MSILAALLAAALAPDGRVAEAANALRMNRPEQARAMIGRAVEEGASGEQVERLLADLAMTERRFEEALARYDALLLQQPDDPQLLEQAGISALNLGRNELAATLLNRAVNRTGASWRAWNALGVVADRKGDYALADRAYAAGLALSPGNGLLRNNRGWSFLLRSRWHEAHAEFSQAARHLPDHPMILANLDLAAAAVASDLPKRRPGESSEDYAARLNDTGAIKLRQGQQGLAIAAFARAIEASDRWFTRAANNLELAAGKDALSAPAPQPASAEAR